ncbi:DNA recombination protein RmuC [Sphingomonas sp.]|uniref:DNA recombination protein RmuC n=1 Tax=Sphingomonas sp. TaxID=28214 RepID=UPI003CC5C589
MAELVLVALLATAIGLAIGWLIASRRAGTLASDLAVAQSRAADAELVRQTKEAVERERNDAHQELRGMKERAAEREAAHARTLDELKQARETMTAQFGHAAAQALETAQTQFLDRAHQRFAESEKLQGEKIAQLLAPVNDRLTKYEQAVDRVEQERRTAFGALDGQIQAMREGQERVSTEAARLVNALRNAPKARGRWGEQSLKNVLEQAGLSPYADFRMEVSVDTEDGRLRPDVIVSMPGGRQLIIDAKCSLNAFLDAADATDEATRKAHLKAHLASIRNHVQQLGSKAYWQQFGDAAEYVVMYIPGEHFLTAAMEQENDLWDWAHGHRVLLATPINLIAIARTVSAVWRQEKLAGEARAIAELGKDLYARLCTMGAHVSRLGKNLATANDAYNSFVGSLESQVLTQAKRFETLNVDTGGKPIDTPAVIDSAVRPLTKLAVLDEAAE